MDQPGERGKDGVFPSLNRTLRIDSRGARISSDKGVLMLREIDETFNVTGPLGDCTGGQRRACTL